MVEIDTLFQTKTAEKPYPFKRGTYLYSLYKGLLVTIGFFFCEKVIILLFKNGGGRCLYYY